MTHISAVAVPTTRPVGRSAGWVPTMILASSVVLVAATVWFGSSLAAGPVESHAYTQSMDGAVRSSTHVQFNAGTLTVGALDAGADSLATMRYEGPASLRPACVPAPL